jgi:hypothetical protein
MKGHRYAAYHENWFETHWSGRWWAARGKSAGCPGNCGVLRRYPINENFQALIYLIARTGNRTYEKKSDGFGLAKCRATRPGQTA